MRGKKKSTGNGNKFPVLGERYWNNEITKCGFFKITMADN